MIATCEKCKGRFPIADAETLVPMFCPPCGQTYAANAREMLLRGEHMAMLEESANDDE